MKSEYYLDALKKELVKGFLEHLTGYEVHEQYRLLKNASVGYIPDEDLDKGTVLALAGLVRYTGYFSGGGIGDRNTTFELTEKGKMVYRSLEEKMKKMMDECLEEQNERRKTF